MDNKIFFLTICFILKHFAQPEMSNDALYNMCEKMCLGIVSYLRPKCSKKVVMEIILTFLLL